MIGGKAEVGEVEKYEEFFANVPAESVRVVLSCVALSLTCSSKQIVAFLDPSALLHNPGWPLRNLLTYLLAIYPSVSASIRILCWRDAEPPTSSSTWKSRFGVISIGERANNDARPSAVGWEKNVQNKLGPRVADLAPMMDPAR